MKTYKEYSRLRVSRKECITNWNKLIKIINNLWSYPVVKKSGYNIAPADIELYPKANGDPYKYLDYQHSVGCEEWNYDVVCNAIKKAFPKAEIFEDNNSIHIKY